MNNLKKIWNFLRFQSYLGSSMPSRDLPNIQEYEESMKKESKIKINGKLVSSQEAKKMIDNEDVIISKASFTIGNPNKNKSEVPNYDGFEIEKRFIGLSAKKKDKTNASILAMSFVKSPKINNNTFAMVILSPKKDLTEQEIEACKVLGINVE